MTSSRWRRSPAGARAAWPPGRGRGDPTDRLDNGQRILIGAYTATLGLMRRVGVDPDAVLQRQPLALLDRTTWGCGCGRAAWSEFGRYGLGDAALAAVGQLALASSAALGWLLQGFRCDAGWTVAQLTAGLPARCAPDPRPAVRGGAERRRRGPTAQVFLRVLR